jgi:hypothetical protein
MRKLLFILSAISLIGIATSCKKDFLNTTPFGAYSDDAVWKDPNLAATFVSNCYENALGYPFAINRMGDCVDETSFTPDWGIFDFNKAVVTQDNITGFEQSWFSNDTYHLLWNQLYANIRACNLFFSKVNGVQYSNDATGQALKTQTIGEVYFLRGYTYHFLVAMYGGVPIITKPYGLGQEYSIARNTYEECINYITGQLDSAAMDLPAAFTGDMRGHATKGAALALKARTLLYAASDLHNTTTYAPGYANPELLGYTTGTQVSRWGVAKAAAKAVIDLGTYSLYKATPAVGDSIAQNFVTYFLSYGYETEDILLQYFTLKTAANNWSAYNPAEYCGPNGYHNWGNNTPLGDMVDQYDMKDGTAFDWTKPAELANPYIKRDARFYASILYEGCPWRKRPAGIETIDPWDKIQVGHVYSDAAGTVQLVPGVDTRQSSIESWNGGRTGYYLRKFVDPTLDPQYVKQDIPFRHMRYAEVLLNYAEACIEENTGSDLADATTNINMIRTRAGQPVLASGLSQAALRTAVRHERRVELAFEDHRFWDVRRWVIGPDAYKPTHRVDVKYITPAAGNYRKADGTTWGAPIYINALLVEETRAWLDKCYFMPIYRDEMNKNTKLIQNPGY